MKINLPHLFVEINNLNYKFIVVQLDENHNLKIIEKFILPNNEIKMNKLQNFQEANKIIKFNIEKIEGKVDFIFKDIVLIIGNLEQTCVSLSAYKRLNGSQVLKENISYILNSLKHVLSQTEKEKTILHIFNSKSILDGNENKNLPIGLFGNFYIHELSFILVDLNELKNIRNMFSKINLNINKIILKDFCEGTQLINNNENIETFLKIEINKNQSETFLFENSSFKFSEKLTFGTEIIYRDIKKICLINENIIKNFLEKNSNETKDFDHDDLLEKNFFEKESFRKIRKKLIFDVLNARVEEILEILYLNNINLNKISKNNVKVFIAIEDKLLEKYFFNYLSKKNIEPLILNNFDEESSIKNIVNLLLYGWKKEAVPVVQTKKSLITRVFNYFFGR